MTVVSPLAAHNFVDGKIIFSKNISYHFAKDDTHFDLLHLGREQSTHCVCPTK